MITFSHSAFSDDSGHEDGRYNSLGLITLAFSKYNYIKPELEKLFFDSGIKNEFKWEKIRNAKYRFAAEKINKLIFKYIDDLRIDVLIWDMQDSRHKGVLNVDNNANLGRMYYHLLSSTLSKRWKIGDTWCWRPDRQSLMDWRSLAKCLVNKKYKTITDLFNINKNDFLKLGLKIIKVSNSKKEPFIQIADYFAGLATYSYGHFNEYKNWLESKSKQKSLFNIKVKKRSLSGAEKVRLPLIESFVEQCKKNKMNISLEKTNGLKTHDPRKHINFWLYQPQNIYDKAPIKNKKWKENLTKIY
jgi:hypothetical protein